MPQWMAGKRVASGDGAAASQATKQRKKEGGGGELRELVAAVGKLTLINSREATEQASMTQETWELPADSGIARTAIEAGALYEEAQKKLHKQKEEGMEVDTGSLGPLYRQVWEAVAQTCTCACADSFATTGASGCTCS